MTTEESLEEIADYLKSIVELLEEFVDAQRPKDENVFSNVPSLPDGWSWSPVTPYDRVGGTEYVFNAYLNSDKAVEFQDSAFIRDSDGIEEVNTEFSFVLDKISSNAINHGRNYKQEAVNEWINNLDAENFFS